MDSGNPYEDFINRLKQNLNDNGKILIAIENRFGLKYWCGANEDHTNKKFDGILGYPNEKSIKTFSKHELEKLASHCKMHYNMYYVFPDYKFPKIIFNDNSLNKKTYSNYFPYYSTKMNLFLSENLLYKEIYENKVIPFFANSYFLEFSLKETKPQVDFIKFNNEYRKKEYDLITYLSNNRIYKKANTKDAEKKIKEILNIHAIAKKCNLPISEIIKDGKEIYSKFLDGENLLDILFNYFSNNEYDKIIQTYDKLYEIIKKSVEKEVFDSNTIFEKYNFAVPKKNNNFKYYKNGFLDIIPSNIMLTNDKYILIDQEWYEENVPVEYIMFRCIYYFFDHIDTNHSLALKLYKKYNINSKFFLKFEMVYMKNLRNQFISYYSQYCNNINYCDNIDNLIDKEVPRLQMQEENFRQLQKKFAILQEENKNNWRRLIETEKSSTKKMLTKYIVESSKGKVNNLDEIYITNAIMCARKGNNYRSDNIKLKECSLNCSKYLERQIDIVKPKIILTLGFYPLLSLSKIFDFKIDKTLSDNINNYGSFNIKDMIIIPLYHPAAQINKEKQMEQYKKIWKYYGEV